MDLALMSGNRFKFVGRAFFLFNICTIARVATTSLKRFIWKNDSNGHYKYEKS